MSRFDARKPTTAAAAALTAVILLLSGLSAPAWAAGSSVSATPTPQPTAAPRPAVTPTPTAAPQPTPTATPTAAPTPSPKAFTAVPKPTVSGVPTFGNVLTAVPGTWKPTATLRYQWRLDGEAVDGAVSRTWKLPAAAVGKRVSVAVTGTRSGYRSTTAVSAATAAVAALKLTPGTMTVSGTPSVGQRLTVTATNWRPAPVALRYQWLRDGKTIRGATMSSYVLSGSDLGRAVSVRIAVHKSGYTTIRRTSTPVRVGLALTATPAPTITGTARVGRTLTVVPGQWGPAPVSLRHQWLRDGKAISGATAATYTLTAADGARKISVRTTGTKRSYTTTSRTSATIAVPGVLSAPAKVTQSGALNVGSTLTANPGTWGPGTVSISYRWMRDGRPIAGATARTYRLTDADATAVVAVSVTGRKTGYTAVTRSTTGGTVLRVFTAAPTPTVSGTAQAGATLTAKTGAWKPSPASLRLQWRVDGSAITGATKSTFVVPTWAAGRSITVSVTATKPDHRTVTKTSAGTRISLSVGRSIDAGSTLRAGVRLTSPDGRYTFGLLGDGNVALARGYTLLRTAKTTGTLDGLLHLTGDGELLLVDADDAAVWSTDTAGRGATALTLGNDGVLRLVDEAGTSVWTSASLPVFSDKTGASASTPGRYGWAYPIRPKATFTTYSGHSGDDIAAPSGTPIYAMRGGVVKVREIWITSGCPSWAPNRTKQKEVEITSTVDGTRIVQVYAHLSRFSIANGQTVSAGQKIGEVGSTGCSTGPHLHTAFTVDGQRYALYPRDVLGTSAY